MYRSLSWLGVVATIALGLGCGSPGSPPDTGAASDAIRVVSLPFIGSAAITIAVEEGYFEDQNLDVEVVNLTRNMEAVPALVRGDVDVGIGQLTVNIVNAIAGGARLRFVIGSVVLEPSACSFNAILARRALVEEGKLDRAEQLQALQVELDPLLPQGFFMSRALEPFDLTVDDLQRVNLPTGANIDALINGSIDVTIASEPLLTRALSSGQAVVWRAGEELVPGYQLSSVMFGPTLLDERPEVGERFTVAFLRGLRQLRAGPTERNVELMALHTGLDPGLVKQLCWPSADPTGRIRPEGLMELQAWLLSRGLIDAVIPEEELIDTRFIDRANAVGVQEE